MYVYIYHLTEPLGSPQTEWGRAVHHLPPRKGDYTPHARHYLGSTENMWQRDREHRFCYENGSKLLRAAINQGIEIVLARVWVADDRELEVYLKGRKETPKYCPICNQRPYVPPFVVEEIDPRLALLPF